MSENDEIRPHRESAQDIADHFGVNRETVYIWVRDTDIPYRRVGGSLRFSLADVDAWAAARVS